MGAWVRGVWEGGSLRLEGEDIVRIVAGTEEYTHYAIALGRSVFETYGVSLKSWPESKVMGIMCELFDSISSRLCLVYDLDARVIKLDQVAEQLDLLDYTVNAITLGIQADARRQVSSLSMFLWRKYTSLGLGKKMGFTSTKQERPPSTQISKNPLHENNSTMMEIERRARYYWLTLLIEWDKKDVIAELLKDIGRNSYFSKRVLNNALQVALEHNRCDIVRALLNNGADTELYAMAASGQEDNTLWKDLLVSACLQSEEPYLKILIQKGRVVDCALSLLVADNDRRTVNASVPEQHCSDWLNRVLSSLNKLRDRFVSNQNKAKTIGEQSAIHELEVCLNNQNLLLMYDFDPREISDDRQAKAILNRIYSMSVYPQYLINTRSENISNSGIEFNFSINAEFDLFMSMVLMNRPDLARLFWILDGRKRTATMFQSALLACLLCRSLMKLPYISEHYHLRSAFGHIADYYEEFVATVLKNAHSRNSERTLSAIGQNLQQCRDWTSLDIIVQANCEKVVESCDSLCIAAVKRRFLGQEDVLSAVTRLYQAWCNGFVDFRSVMFRSGILNKETVPKGTLRRKSTFRLRKVVTEINDQVVTTASNGWMVFLLCIMIDSVGVLQFFSPILPFPFGFLWAPVSASLLYCVHENSLMSAICLVEELLPFMSVIPSASLSCMWIQSPADDNTEEVSSYLPIDYFILDAISHLVLTFMMTYYILMEPSIMANVLEIFIIIVFLLDEIPDMLFAGVNSRSTSMVEVLLQGFSEYWATTGERFEFCGMACFLIGFILRYSIFQLCMVLILAYFSLAHGHKIAIYVFHGPKSSPLLVRQKGDAISDLGGLARHVMGFGETEKMEFNFSTTWKLIFFLIQVVVFGSVVFQCFSFTVASELGFVFYGFSAFVMWMRTLHFILVQQDLGQFVRVMLNMGSDLGFFSIVWGILILAFSCAMLGAGVRDGVRDDEESQEIFKPENDDKPLPMQSWGTWWIMQTYLQSLGQDNIENMTSHTSNFIFIFMWPIFNVLLVNLLVAVMSDRYIAPRFFYIYAHPAKFSEVTPISARYEEAKEKSVVSYFFNLFRLSRDYELKVRTNPWTFVWYLLLWRISVGQNVQVTAGPAETATTLAQNLFEFVEFVTNKKRPKVVRHYKSETVLVQALSNMMKESELGSGVVYNEAECLKLKQELRKAIHQKSQSSWEEQRVQDLMMEVSRPLLEAEMLGKGL